MANRISHIKLIVIPLFLFMGCNQTNVQPSATHEPTYTCGEIDAIKIIKNTSIAKDAEQRILDEFSARDKQLVSTQKTLAEFEESYYKNYKTYAPTEKKAIQDQILERKKKLIEQQQAFKNDLNMRRHEELETVKNIIMNKAFSLVKTEQLDGLISVDNRLIYSRIDENMPCHKRIPFTQKVIHALNQNN